MDDSKTFREQLAIQYPTLGRALWEPDPGGLYDAVQVGDVGFIRQGYFYRLFNALPPGDHPSDHPPEPDPFPQHLQRLQPRTSDHIRTTRSRDHGEDFRSTSVSREPNIYALGPDDVTFSCSGRQGALLYLPFPTATGHGRPRGFWQMDSQNIHDCVRLAEDRGLGVSRMEDIIIVTGRHLAKSWVRAVFSECQEGAQVSFGIQTSGDSVVHLEKRNVSGAQLKFGPNGRDLLPEDQCIFVRGYRVVRVLNIWPRLRGLAGPAPDLDGPEPDTHLQLIGVPSDDDASNFRLRFSTFDPLKYQDPLHILLEYISEQAHGCDMVLVHDDDLECIEGVIPPSKNLQPDEWMALFRDNAPSICQFQCEFLPETESEAEVAIATVATLSWHMFEAPLDEEGTSRSISTPKATSKGYGHLTEELDGLDEHTFAAQPDKLTTSTPSDAEDQFKMQASILRLSLPPSASSSSGAKSSQRPTTDEVSTLDPVPDSENVRKLAGIVAEISSAADKSTYVSVQIKASLRECSRKLEAECAMLSDITQLAHRAAHDASNVLLQRIRFFDALDDRILELSRLCARFVDSRRAFHEQPNKLLLSEIRNARGHDHGGMLSGLNPLFDKIDKNYKEVHVSLRVEEDSLKKIRGSSRVTPDDKRRWELIREACMHASNLLTTETSPPKLQPMSNNKATRHIQELAQTVTDARQSVLKANRDITNLTQNPPFGVLRLISEYHNCEKTCRQRISEVLEFSEYFLQSFVEVPPLDDFRDYLLPTAAAESSHILQEVSRQMKSDAHAVLRVLPALQGNFTLFDRYLPIADASIQRMYSALRGLVQPLQQPDDPHKGVFRMMKPVQLREEQRSWRSLEEQWEAQLHL